MELGWISRGPQSRTRIRRPQRPGDQRQRGERFALHGRRQQQHEHDIHRLSVDGIELDPLLQLRKQPNGPLQIRQSGMGNGDALADPGRSQFFPLLQKGRHLIGRQTETGCGLGRQFL
jgi:hypothetical protein